MLQSRVEAHGVLAHDDEINVRIASGDMGQIAHGAEVGIKLELLTELDVNAGESAADRCGDWPLERYMRALNGFRQCLRDVFFVFFVSFRTSLDGFPFELDP